MAIKVQNTTVIDDDKVFILGSGTTSERPISPVNGMLRYNNETNNAELFANTAWGPLAGSPAGDIQYFTAAPSSDWLKADGSIALQSEFPSVFSKVGLFADAMNSWSLRSGITGTNNKVAYNGTRYAIGTETGQIKTSTDAITWSVNTVGYTSTNSFAAPAWTVITSPTGSFVAGSTLGEIQTSTDSISWNKKYYINDLGLLSRNFYALNDDSLFYLWTNADLLLTTTDSNTWNATSLPALNSTNARLSEENLVYGNNRFATAGSGGAQRTSTDFINWSDVTPHALTSGYYNTILSFARGPVNTSQITHSAASGIGATLRTSTDDGVTWTNRSFPINISDPRVHSSYSSPSKIVIFQEGLNLIASSTDAITWTSSSIAENHILLSIASIADGSAYVASANPIFGNRAVYTSTDANTWTASTILPPQNNFRIVSKRTVDWSVSRYLAHAGIGNTVYSSSDGVNWTSRSVPAGGNSINLSAHFKGNEWLCASSFQLFYSSNDAQTWTAVSFVNSDTINWTLLGGTDTLAYAIGLNYDQGFQYQMYTSANGGNTWTFRTTIGSVFSPFAFGNGSTDSVVLTGGGGGQILRSTNRTTFTGLPNASITSLKYLNNNFIFGDAAGNIGTSTDSITWTVTTTPSTRLIGNITYGNNVYFAASSQQLLTSTNITTWTQITSPTGSDFISHLEYGAGVLVLADSTGKFHTSTNDGATWTVNFTDAAGEPRKLKYLNNLFVYVGSSGRLRTSTDGITWAARTLYTSTDINDIFYGAGYFYYRLSGGRNGHGYSSDGIDWTPGNRAIERNNFLYDGNNYIFSGPILTNLQSILSSTDLNNWTNNKVSARFFTTKYLNNTYIGAGQNGLLFTSTNAVTWTARTSNTTSQIYDIAYGEGIYLYVGQGSVSSGMLGTSTDAITWTARTLGTTTRSINSVIYTPAFKQFLYGGDNGEIGTSEDGILWTARTYGSTNVIYDVNYLGNLYFAIGGQLRTSPGTTYDSSIEFKLPKLELRDNDTNKLISTAYIKED